jgi:putative ABC transport system permease protein
MIKSYFIIAFRNMLRSRTFTGINVFGLACGISVSLLMFIHIRYELSYDKFFPDHNLIYRVASERWAKTSPVLAPKMKNEHAEAQNITRFFRNGASVLRGNDKVIPTEHNYLVDQAVFSVFSFPFVYGSAEKALLDPSSIVITRDVAEKLYGKTDPTGKVLGFDDYKEYTITGVMENVPKNSHLKIETLMSIEGTDVAKNTSLTWKGVDNYVRFKSPEDAAAMSGKLLDFEAKYFERVRTPEELERDGHIELHPVSSIHLYSHREKEMGRNSDIQYIYIFSALAVFIILIASINFINLFTARSVRRMKEIGVKKVMGASRAQLFRQFLSETFMMTVISTILALMIAELFLPVYNEISGLSLTGTSLLNSSNLLLVGGITIVVALLSGFYPALVISRYRITESLGRYSPKGGIGILRRVLVTFQFMISCMVILLTVVVSTQMSYIRNLDLGLSKEGVVTVKLYGQLVKEMHDNPEALRNRLMANHNVTGVAVSSKLIGERIGLDGFGVEGMREEDRVGLRMLRADEGFVSTLGLTVIAGRDFLPTDTTGVFMLNEEAAKVLSRGGKIEDLIGKGLGFDPAKPEGVIVGIVKDYNYASVHTEIEPLLIVNADEWPENLFVRIGNTDDLATTLEFIKSEISEFTPGSLVIFNFLDDQLKQMYEAENNLFAVFNVFSVLSVIIAILGLVALSAHSIEVRVKEIGIRKVLGATVSDILLILSNEYTRLLIIASALSIPLAWYVAGMWLTSFAYQVSLAWWMFVVPCVLLVLFTLLVLAMQALKPANTDPVKSLRYE